MENTDQITSLLGNGTRVELFIGARSMDGRDIGRDRLNITIRQYGHYGEELLYSYAKTTEYFTQTLHLYTKHIHIGLAGSARVRISLVKWDGSNSVIARSPGSNFNVNGKASHVVDIDELVAEKPKNGA